MIILQLVLFQPSLVHPSPNRWIVMGDFDLQKTYGYASVLFYSVYLALKMVCVVLNWAQETQNQPKIKRKYSFIFAQHEFPSNLHLSLSHAFHDSSQLMYIYLVDSLTWSLELE